MSLRRSLRSVLATLLLVTLVACGGDDPAGPDLTAGPLSARIDGVVYTAVSAFAVNSGGIVAVGASNLSGEGLGFGFQGSTTGTYTIGPSIPTTANITTGSDVWSAGPGTGSGSVVITTLTSTRVAGTFAFEVVSTTGTPANRSITEGTFDVDF
jgi:hypothetical protein